MDKTSLGDRMKDYEAVTASTLLRRTPVIIRVDGKAFHTFTRKRLSKDLEYGGPFNHMMHNTMVSTTQAMMQNMQNAVIGYTQSDEISILLRDWDKHETQQWFGGKLQKIASVSAAMATGYFNFFFQPETDKEFTWVGDVPLFDSRVFQVPKEEVTNYFIWRQQDATRNSVQMLGRHYMSHGDMNGQNISNVQDMLMSRYGINWNCIDTWKKRGTCVVPNPNRFDSSTAWLQDEEIPIFTADRNYVESRLVPEEE